MPLVERLVVTDVRCPFCGTVIPKVFARLRAPVANSHRTDRDPHGSHGQCRVIVVIDPEGSDHKVHRVPEGVTEIAVMQQIMETMRAA
jgi:hypothetical protein